MMQGGSPYQLQYRVDNYSFSTVRAAEDVSKGGRAKLRVEQLPEDDVSIFSCASSHGRTAGAGPGLSLGTGL